MNYPLTIYTVYHDDKLINEYNLNEDKHHKLFGTHKNMPGDSINYLQKIVNEGAAIYYVCKNNLKSDYVGFEHYRRRFIINDIKELNSDTCYVAYLDDNGPYYCDEFEMEFKILFSLLDKNYYNYFMFNKKIIGSELFIMFWNNYVKMCEFIFDIMFKFDKLLGGNMDIENYKRIYNEDMYKARWHILERLISAYIILNFGLENTATININDIYY